MDRRHTVRYSLISCSLRFAISPFATARPPIKQTEVISDFSRKGQLLLNQQHREPPIRDSAYE